MSKIEFLAALEEKLQALPDKERKESLEYYAEIIDDHMDEGMREEDAVAACGSMDEIVEQIVIDTPLAKLVKQKVKPKRKMRAWEIVLLILGFPLWFSLLIAFFCVLVAISACLWAIVITVFAVSVAFGGTAIGLTALALMYMVQGQFLPALVAIGCALIFAGLTILFFLLGKYTAKGVAWLHKITFRGIKRCFIRKEAKA